MRRHGTDTALALHGFNHDRGGLIGDRGLERVVIAERHMVKATGQFAKACR